MHCFLIWKRLLLTYCYRLLFCVKRVKWLCSLEQPYCDSVSVQEVKMVKMSNLTRWRIRIPAYLLSARSRGYLERAIKKLLTFGRWGSFCKGNLNEFKWRTIPSSKGIDKKKICWDIFKIKLIKISSQTHFGQKQMKLWSKIVLIQVCSNYDSPTVRFGQQRWVKKFCRNIQKTFLKRFGNHVAK